MYGALLTALKGLVSEIALSEETEKAPRDGDSRPKARHAMIDPSVFECGRPDRIRDVGYARHQRQLAPPPIARSCGGSISLTA